MPNPSKNPAYRIETDRLLIRCWDPADAALRRDEIIASNEYLRPWIPFMRDEPRSLSDTVQMLRRERANFDCDVDYRYAVFSRDGRVLIGETGLYTRAGEGAREIGYWVGQAHAGSGYCTEAAAAMVKVGFEIEHLDRVEIHCSEANPASAAVARKLGFTHEATLRDRFLDTQGTRRDTMLWSMFADAYAGSPAVSRKLAAFDCAGAQLL